MSNGRCIIGANQTGIADWQANHRSRLRFADTLFQINRQILKYLFRGIPGWFTNPEVEYGSSGVNENHGGQGTQFEQIEINAEDAFHIEPARFRIPFCLFVDSLKQSDHPHIAMRKMKLIYEALEQWKTLAARAAVWVQSYEECPLRFAEVNSWKRGKLAPLRSPLSSNTAGADRK